MNTALRLGIDLGGTKTEAVVLNEAGQVLWRERQPTPQGGYAHIIDDLEALVAKARKACACEFSIGVGIPGALSRRTGLVKNANSTQLNGQDFKGDLEVALGQPVRLENDANCFAMSEARDGAGAGFPVVLGLILGTGVGSGIVAHGKLLRGSNHVAGEWGHNRLYVDDAAPMACYCGRINCIETFVSGPGWLRREQALGSPYASTHAIVAAAQAEDKRAQRSIARYACHLAQALAQVLNILDPDVVVLGGGMGQLPGLDAMVAEQVPAFFFSDVCGTIVRRPVHGDSSGVRGAAWLWEAA